MKTVLIIVLTIGLIRIVWSQANLFDTSVVNNKLTFQINLHEVNDSFVLLKAKHDLRVILNDTLESPGRFRAAVWFVMSHF